MGFLEQNDAFFYLEHDHSLKQTVRALGYPSESMLKYWVRGIKTETNPVAG